MGNFPANEGRDKEYVERNELADTAPANASATGEKGEIRVASGFLYVCVATNTWQRVAIATW